MIAIVRVSVSVRVSVIAIIILFLTTERKARYGFCPYGKWDCSAENIAKTCSGFPDAGGVCAALSQYPNVELVVAVMVRTIG